jgi:hypothetical protein
VYDNAAPGRSTSLQVSLSIQLATHYLSDIVRPICSAKDTHLAQGCTWVFTNDQDRQRVASTCIISKAVSSQLTQKLQSQGVSHPAVGDESTQSDGADALGESNSNNELPRVDFSLQESQSVIVQVHAPFGSPRLILLTLAPIVVLFTLWFLENGTGCMQHVRRNNRSVGGQRDQQQSSLPIGKEESLRTADDERTSLNKSRDR